MSSLCRLALIAVVVVALAGCGGGAPSSSAPATGQPATAAPAPAAKIRVAIVTNGANPFWEPMEVGARRAEEKFGCQAMIQHPNPKTSGEQIRMLENMISQKVDGISFSPLDSEAIADTAKKAIDAGILVICMDSDAPKTGRLAYIGTINYKAGVEAGKAAKAVFPNGAKLVAQVGSLSAQNARDRLQGFKDTIVGASIEILEVMTDDLLPGRAQSNAETALLKYSDMDGFLCLYSYNAPAAARALELVGKVGKVKIIGFDAEPQTLEYLEKGVIDVCIGQKPYDFGYKSVELLYRMKTEGKEKVLGELPADKVIDTGVDVITRENLPAYKENLAKLGIKSS